MIEPTFEVAAHGPRARRCRYWRHRAGHRRYASLAAAHEFEAAGLRVVPAPTDVWAPREVDTMGFVPTAIGLLRSYNAVYELVGEGLRDLLVATHLRRTIR